MRRGIHLSRAGAATYAGKLLLIMALVTLQAGCASGGAGAALQDDWVAPVGQGPAGSVHVTSPANASRELAAVKRMMKAGEYSLAIPKLQQILDKYPGDASAVEGHYHLGEAYYNVGAFSSALDCLNKYEKLAPDGAYLENSRALVSRLTGTAATAPPTEQDAQIAALEAAITAKPDEMAPRLELAEMLWSLGRYDEAGKVYTELLQRWPRLETDDRAPAHGTGCFR